MVDHSTAPEGPGERDRRLALVADMKYELVPLRSVDVAVAALPPASPVSITCSPVRGIDATMQLTDHVRSLGHTAVPHLSARMVEGPDHAHRIARWLRTEAVGHAFLVGGDIESPAGPYHDATHFLRALLDAGPELTSIGVTAYPDGHPFIDDAALRQALHGKQSILSEAGIACYAVTQMCFDPATVTQWLTTEREAGLTLPVHLGLAGVVDRKKLMTMGVRLGVGTSLRYLRKNRSAVGRLLTTSRFDPNTLLEPLSRSLDALDIAGLHCFTFNQVASTVSWQRATLDQR
ncbi:MAG: methylenetetrahydrofolate reductase [Acidimicrobiia bacterium]|nr:methylenetetrahydrofolate reductase [Acidimicrobiia bacterium]